MSPSVAKGVYRIILRVASDMQRHRPGLRVYIHRLARDEFRRPEPRLELALKTAAFLERARDQAGIERKVVNNMLKVHQFREPKRSERAATSMMRQQSFHLFLKSVREIETRLGICLISSELKL